MTFATISLHLLCPVTTEEGISVSFENKHIKYRLNFSSLLLLFKLELRHNLVEKEASGFEVSCLCYPYIVSLKSQDYLK